MYLDRKQIEGHCRSPRNDVAHRMSIPIPINPYLTLDKHTSDVNFKMAAQLITECFGSNQVS
jgi:hypothetical protein